MAPRILAELSRRARGEQGGNGNETAGAQALEDKTSQQELDDLLQSVLERARALVQSEGAALCLLRPEVDGLEVRALSGSVEMANLAVRTGRLRCLTEQGSCLCSESESCSVCLAFDDRPPASGLVAPLKEGGKILGALCVAWKEARPSLQEDRASLAEVAAEATLAIESVRRFNTVRAVASRRERERLAREMHDGPAQELGYLHLRLKTLEDRLEELGQSPTLGELAEMRKAAATACGELRQSIGELRSIAHEGLVPALTEWLREFSRQSGIPVELESSDARATRFAPEVRMPLLRVIQEALTNVRKHAGGCDAWVRFAVEGNMSRVTVADNGLGFAVESAARPGRQRFGLRTMRERAEALGGSLEVRSSLGKGTQVVLRVPLACGGGGQ